jgi:hypothetical protein
MDQNSHAVDGAGNTLAAIPFHLQVTGFWCAPQGWKNADAR